MGGGAGGDENERTRSLPLSPSSRPSIFFSGVNFFPALCYLNAWNRLVERIWEGGGVLLTILGSPDPIFRPYFSFFLTHLSKKDSKNSRSARSCPKRHMPIWLQKGSTLPSLGGKEHRSFFEKISVLPCLREFKTVLSSFDARDSVFRNICQCNMDTVSQSLVGFLIP